MFFRKASVFLLFLSSVLLSISFFEDASAISYYPRPKTAEINPTDKPGNPIPEKYTGTSSGTLITIDFEELSNLQIVGNHYASLGVAFSGATILTQGGNLNFLCYPPKSGIDVVYDDPNATDPGKITATFDPSITGAVQKVGGYVTGSTNIGMTAYDSNGNVLGYSETGGSNYAVDPDCTPPSELGTPNILLEIQSSTPIAYVVFADTGNTFTIDDFFFESDISCFITGVPLLKQNNPSSWGNDHYGGSTSSPFIDPYTHQPALIKDWGCALTAVAMVVNYHGQQQNGFSTNPRLLNDWLRGGNQGYDGGFIKWQKVGEYARNIGGIDLYFYEGRAPDNGIVNELLCSGYPVVLEIPNSHPQYTNGHYVVANGIVDSSAWAVNDPGGYNLTQLGTNEYSGIRKYGPYFTGLSSLSVRILSPLELVVTDPAGRRTGYDPTTGTYYDEILDAVYEIETVGTHNGSGASISSLVFSTGSPLNGKYLFEFTGTGTGFYSVSFLAYDSSGSPYVQEFSGTAIPGHVISVEVEFSDSSGIGPINILENRIYLPIVENGN